MKDEMERLVESEIQLSTMLGLGGMFEETAFLSQVPCENTYSFPLHDLHEIRPRLVLSFSCPASLRLLVSLGEILKMFVTLGHIIAAQDFSICSRRATVVSVHWHLKILCS